MGQGESVHKVDYLLEKDKLIKQYRGVDINSYSAPSSRVSTPHIVPKHSLHRNQKFWDNPDYRTFLETGNDLDSLLKDSPANGVTNHKKNTKRYGSLKIPKKTNVVEGATGRKQTAVRKETEDTEPLIENRSSSEKIFEEHAQYANELLNAPYRFQTSFASVENVAFQRSTGDVSLADSKIGITPINDKANDRLVNNILNISSKPVVSVNKPNFNKRESKAETNASVDSDTQGKVLKSEYIPPAKDLKSEEGFFETYLNKSLGEKDKKELVEDNTKEDDIQKQSRVGILKEKFEIQGKNLRPPKVPKKPAVGLSKSIGTALPSPKVQEFHHKRRSSIHNKDSKINNGGHNEHEVLTRKKAVLVEVGSDLNTETTESLKHSSDYQQGGSLTTDSQDPLNDCGSNTESSVFNPHADIGHTGRVNNHKSVVPSKVEVNCGEVISPHKNAKTAVVGVPSVSTKVTINGAGKADIEQCRVQSVTSQETGDLDYVNCVNNRVARTSPSHSNKNIHSEEPTLHKQARVESLRRKFEHIVLQHKDKTSKEAPGKLETNPISASQRHDIHSLHRNDPLFELHKFPVVKSRSDSEIKLVEKEHKVEQGHSKQNNGQVDVIYDDTLVRNPHLRKSLKSSVQIKRINIPETQGRSDNSVAGHLQRTSHFKNREVVVNKDSSIPIEEHLYEEYSIKIPPVEARTEANKREVALPIKKERQKKKKRIQVETPPQKNRHKKGERQSVVKQQQKSSAGHSPVTKRQHPQRGTSTAVSTQHSHKKEVDSIPLPVVKPKQQQRRKSAELLSGDCITAQQKQETNGSLEKKQPKVSKHPPQTHITEVNNMDFRRSKTDSKRHRRKSDSSTSNLSDSSTQPMKSSKKWKKSSKEHKEKSRKQVLVNQENDDPRLSQQWGSMINEYQEKYAADDRGRKTRPDHYQPHQPHPGVNRINNLDQYNNVRQVFNRGMVLPVKRAPPGLSAQEVESESGATDYSTHSWTAMHRANPGGMRAHMDAAEYHNGGSGQTYVKGRIDDSFSSSVGAAEHTGRHGNRMRVSSQSSQYTSDIPPLSPGRQRRVMANDIGHHQHHQVYSDTSMHRSVTPEAAYHHSRLARYHSDNPSSPEVPRRMRLARQYVSYNSDGGTMSPTLIRRTRQSSVPAREHSYLLHGDDGRLRDRSVSRERLEYGGSLQRPVRLQQQRYSKARSLSRDRLDNNHIGGHRRIHSRSMSTDALDYGRPVSPHFDHRVREKSISREYIDHNGAPLSPASHRKKLVKFDQKKQKKKKGVDQKAKNFVDDVIDEAIDMFSLSPRNKRKSKSKEKITSSKKNHTQRNIVHTTNIYNEFVEEDSPDYEEGKYIDKRAFSDFEDYRSYNHEGRAVDDFEHDLRSLREQQLRKPSALRPQPINGSLSTERRSCMRPIAGSGVTRDGSAPPPKSAYKNYDFELSVGPNQYNADDKRNKNKSHQYISDSEFSTLDIRNRKKSSYPNVKFGPAKAKSEDNLLSEIQKPVVMTNMHVPQQHKVRSVTKLKSAKSIEYDSDIEDKRKVSPPTLTRGMVTKIMHKLEDDVNKLTSLKAKPKQRQQVEVDTFRNDVDLTTSTWPKKDTIQTQQSQTSQVGAILYGTLPAEKSEGKPYSTYLPLLNDSTGPLLTSSPVTSNTQQTNNPKIEITPDLRQSANKPQTGGVAHTRFKMYHGDHVKLHPMDEQSKSMQMPSENLVQNTHRTKEQQENSYGVFSNENMIVAGLGDNNARGSRRPSQSEKYQVRKIGQLYATQPDISMNKQQTLNFYLFNQIKNQDEENEKSDKLKPQVNYMARNVEYTNMGKKEKQADIFVHESKLPETETELREYFIHHKQTQTPAAAAKQRHKSKKVNKYTAVQQQARPPPQKHTETTHYVTKEREIERVSPKKQFKESSIQTDQEKLPMVQHYERPESEEEERAYSTEEEFFSEQVVEQHASLSVPLVGKDIPIHKEQDWNTRFKEKLESEYRQEYLPVVEMESHQMEIATKSDEEDDDDTVILEMFEKEEKEQRISMAIFEEVEFSHKRTEGGKTVSVGGIDGESEIPIFWEPDEYEGVVDTRKKKMLQVNQTDQKGGNKRSKHPKGSLTFEEGSRPLTYSQNGQLTGLKPMSVQEERKINSSVKQDTDVAEVLSEDIAALDKVLEDELAKDEQAAEAFDTSKKKFEYVKKMAEDGVPVTETRTSYDKEVHFSRKSPSKFDHKETNSAEVFSGRHSPRKFDNTDVNDKELYVDRSSPSIFDHREVKVPIYSSSPSEKDSFRVIENVFNPYKKNKHFYGPDCEYIGSSKLQGRNTLPNDIQKSPDINKRISRIRNKYNQYYPKPNESPSIRRERRTTVSRERLPKLTSHHEPTNVSFMETSSAFQRDTPNYPNESGSPQFNAEPPMSSFHHATVHSEQGEPKYETHYEKDADGNTVKVTEWQHKLSKTVAYPPEEPQVIKQNMNELLPEAGYINMNLHEGIMTSGKASDEETETTIDDHIIEKGSSRADRNHTDVTEETEVGLKPYHFESRETTMKVTDDTDLPNEKQFLYDIKQAKLKPVPKGYRNGWGRKHTYGTMSTQL